MQSEPQPTHRSLTAFSSLSLGAQLLRQAQPEALPPAHNDAHLPLRTAITRTLFPLSTSHNTTRKQKIATVRRCSLMSVPDRKNVISEMNADSTAQWALRSLRGCPQPHLLAWMRISISSAPSTRDRVPDEGRDAALSANPCQQTPKVAPCHIEVFRPKVAQEELVFRPSPSMETQTSAESLAPSRPSEAAYRVDP